MAVRVNKLSDVAVQCVATFIRVKWNTCIYLAVSCVHCVAMWLVVRQRGQFVLTLWVTVASLSLFLWSSCVGGAITAELESNGV